MSIVSDSIQSLRPYQPGKPIAELERELGLADIIKLASNENPLGPSPAALEAIRREAGNIHLYPDAATFDLRERLAAFHGVPADHIVAGNGSNEILNLVARTFLRPNEHRASLFDYSFIAYRLILKAFGVPFDVVSVGTDWVQSVDAMLSSITPKTRLVFIANPNNPTGTHISRDDLSRFLAAVPDDVFVCVDEAYVQYATDPSYVSALEMRDVHQRLIVSRTFSKCYALAGLRIGYAIAQPEFVDFMNRVREPFNCNAIAQSAAIASLGDVEFVTRSAQTNSAGREQLIAGLPNVGLTPVRSETNFLLCHVTSDYGTGAQLYEALLGKGIIVRPLAGYGIADHVRISIGTEPQNARLLDTLSMLSS